jgi:hypothetical protein
MQEAQYRRKLDDGLEPAWPTAEWQEDERDKRKSKRRQQDRRKLSKRQFGDGKIEPPEEHGAQRQQNISSSHTGC